MSKPTLLILAAGVGSRYGGLKQLDKFGPNGETIMDYSLYDAIKAGFGKVVFIIREELKADFEEIFGSKLVGKIDYDFAIQGFQRYVPADLGAVERSKPWGTGHAVLCATEQTHTPFAVINADDFYGYEAFKVMADFLSTDSDQNLHAMVGYQLKNTLSENGTVARGVCDITADGKLKSVTERTKIIREDNRQIVFIEGEEKFPLADNTTVSMNFWGFKPNVFPVIREMFEDYARLHFDAPKAEFYIPTVMTHLIQQGLGTCQVFESQSEWFGVTYPDDKKIVVDALEKLHQAGKYPN